MAIPKNKEEVDKIVKGIKETVRSLLSDNDRRKVKALDEEIEDLVALKDILDTVMSFENKLSLMPGNQLSDTEKLWLLAHEASESRIAKMGSDNTEESKKRFIDSMNVLNKFINE